MKIKMMMNAGIISMAVMMILVSAGGVLAAPYYTVGNGSSATAMQEFYQGGVQAIKFFPAFANDVTGPAGDTIIGSLQQISGIYTLSYVSGPTLGLYNLTKVGGGTSTITVDTNDLSTTLFTAVATALQIDFTNHTISWSSVTSPTFNDTIGSTALTDLAGSATYAFTSFTFESLGTETAWLSGNTGLTYNARYASELQGFSAAPEPAEWMLMFIGLGMLGFYLRRRGYLNFELSPQAVA